MILRRVSLFVVALMATMAQADVVTDWNNAALNAIRADKTPPPKASRALAILHASIYDAVNGIDRRYEAYFVQSAVPASASREAAASAAAHRALVVLRHDFGRDLERPAEEQRDCLGAISRRSDTRLASRRRFRRSGSSSVRQRAW